MVTIVQFNNISNGLKAKRGYYHKTTNLSAVSTCYYRQVVQPTIETNNDHGHISGGQII